MNSGMVGVRPAADPGTEDHEPLSDVGRLLAVIWAAEELQHALTTAELEAACFLLAEDPAPELSFSYSFRFAARPRSDQLYDELMAIEDAGLAVRRSPLHILPKGRTWLARPEWATEAEGARTRARELLAGYFQAGGDLIGLSLAHA
jgi:hypothetical protein